MIADLDGSLIPSVFSSIGFVYPVIGLDFGLIHFVEDRMYGLQFGLLNFANILRGMQFGLLNLVEEVYGFQVGLINKTEVLHGVQFGLLNFSEDRDGQVRVRPMISIRL